MDGKSTMVPRAGIAALGLLAMAGWMSGVSAADGALVPVVAVQDDSAELPRFEPSTDDFERQFAPFEDPAAVAVQPGAVDLATVDPIVEAPGEDLGEGVASWYGARFAGRKTASGERFDPGEMTAAHRTLPFGSRVRVTHGGKSVIVRINDRGPFHGGRVIDLSKAAADELGLVGAGSGRVQLALLRD
jgi:rare lipoprotein A